MCTFSKARLTGRDVFSWTICDNGTLLHVGKVLAPTTTPISLRTANTRNAWIMAKLRTSHIRENCKCLDAAYPWDMPIMPMVVATINSARVTALSSSAGMLVVIFQNPVCRVLLVTFSGKAENTESSTRMPGIHSLKNWVLHQYHRYHSPKILGIPPVSTSITKKILAIPPVTRVSLSQNTGHPRATATSGSTGVLAVISQYPVCRVSGVLFLTKPMITGSTSIISTYS